MRRVRYVVAMSLDAYIAGPAGEHDWIIMDPAIDFAAFYDMIDTILIGRRTFEFVHQGGSNSMAGMRTFVFSRTLRAEDVPKRMILADDAVATVAALRAEAGKDIWLFGGGVLFRSLLEAGLVDTVEVGIMPVLLGQGIPLLPNLPRSTLLELTHSETLPSGTVSLHYTVRRDAPRKKGRRR